MAEALAGLARAAAEADLAELRLDYFEEPYDLARLLGERACPVVVTLRPRDQGGRSEAAADERLEVLRRAADLGAEYVDLEWDAARPEAVAALKAGGARVIVSRHDFERVPEGFEGWCAELAGRGAEVVKMVGMARDVRDCLAVLRAFQRTDRPTIALAMGEAGLPSRVLSLREERCLLTYAALGPGGGTAPGQPTAAELRGVYHAERLGSGTAVYGLLGHHADVERAAEYNGWFAAARLDAVAVPFVASADAPGIVEAYRELPVAGWHVHGEELQTTVGQALDELSPKACRQGKVNAIVGRGGALVGEWVESPREQFALWTGREPAAG
jgi:3-dehydroquinate dehydratase/shikimate dehydrogenase